MPADALGGARQRRFSLLLLALAGSIVALAILLNRSFNEAQAPRREMEGTVSVSVATQPVAHWTGAAVCSRVVADVPITDIRAPNIGSLPGADVWIVLLLDVPDGVIIALGGAPLDKPPFDPTSEYGGGVPGGMVEQSADRDRGTVTFELPLFKGDAFPLDGAEASLVGSLTWTCEAG